VIILGIVEVLKNTDIEILEEVYQWLYDADNISNKEDRKKHLIDYTIIYHQFMCMNDNCEFKFNFICDFIEYKIGAKIERVV